MMRGRFAVLTSKYYIYFVPSFIQVYIVSLNSQKNEVLGNISYIQMGILSCKLGSL